MNKTMIVANNKKHLKELIKNEIKSHGNDCDLNHIDISNITDLSFLFTNSKFNGNISKWDTSNVTDMNCLFAVIKTKFKSIQNLKR